jgi:hypothetical protein
MAQQNENFKKYLINEGMSRISSKMRKIASKLKNADVKSILLKEADDRLSKLSALSKESMAWNTGYTGLDSATVNLEWQMPNLGDKAQKIKAAIEEKFMPYMKADLIGASGKKRQHKVQGGFVVENLDPETGNIVPEFNPTLVMRFLYRRNIVPMQKEDAESNNRATEAISTVDQFLQQSGVSDYSLMDFIRTLENEDVGLTAYFHTSQGSAEKGLNFSHSELRAFFDDQKNKSSQYGMLPGNINSRYFFAQHAERNRVYESDSTNPSGSIFLSRTKEYRRRFPIESVDQIKLPSDLMRAIARKVRDGFALNANTLWRDIQTTQSKYIEKMGIQDPTAMQSHYRQMFDRINKTFYDGMREQKAQKGDPAVEDDFTWGKTPHGYRQGLVATRTGKAYKSELTVEELRLMLKNCTSDMLDYYKSVTQPQNTDQVESQFSSEYAPFLGVKDPQQRDEIRNSFTVPKHKMNYSSNGMDTDPTTAAGVRTLAIPALRKLPPTNFNDGTIIFDRDNGNLGRQQITKNWINPSGGGLSRIVIEFGPWATKVLQSLSQQTDFFKNKPYTAGAARAISIFNRTNAESVFDVIREYQNDWNRFKSEYLGQSFVNELRLYYKYLSSKDPNPVKDAISQYQKTGDWNEFSRAVRHLIPTKDTDVSTTMDENGFRTFCQYGYQIAKLMDYVSCLMNAACLEQLESRLDKKKKDPSPVAEQIFGRKYSSSSGKGNGGQVMIGIRYAYNAPEVVDENEINPDGFEYGKHVMNLIKIERKRRHDAYRIKGPTYRQTSHWENLGQKSIDTGETTVPVGEHLPLPGQTQEMQVNPMIEPTTKVIKVVENLEYFIGEAGSAEGMLRDLERGTDWNKVLDSFLRRYPNLESSINVLISPINARFDLLEVAAKKAIDNVRKQLEKEIETSGQQVAVEVIVHHDDGREEVLSTDKIDSDVQQLQSQDIEIPQGFDETTEIPAAPVEDTGKYETGIPSEVTSTPAAQPPVPSPQEPAEMLPTPIQQPQSPIPGSGGKVKKPDGRQLKKPNVNRGFGPTGSVFQRMSKIASELDRRGLDVLADKIDFINSELQRIARK